MMMVKATITYFLLMIIIIDLAQAAFTEVPRK
jgi:hypothetical protein